MNLDLGTEVRFEKDSIIMLVVGVVVAGAILILLNRVVKK